MRQIVEQGVPGISIDGFEQLAAARASVELAVGEHPGQPLHPLLQPSARFDGDSLPDQIWQLTNGKATRPYLGEDATTIMSALEQSAVEPTDPHQLIAEHMLQEAGTSSQAIHQAVTARRETERQTVLQERQATRVKRKLQWQGQLIGAALLRQG